MIELIGRQMKIDSGEVWIGLIGDNEAERRQFLITESRLFGLDFKLDVKSADDEKNIIDLDKTVNADNILLTWVIKKEHLQKSGLLKIMLRAIEPTTGGMVWQSKEDHFTVSESIGAVEHFSTVPPSEFEQIEQRITDMRNAVSADRSEVATNKNIVAENTAGVIEKASEALESAAAALESERNAKTSEDNAKESEDAAGESMVAATQAMQDLLAMMGNDIATLTGGKLTPSQIPAIAVTDTFVVDNEADMLALVAETGDVCIRTDESKTYILQGTDPTILEQWKQLQVPTNYADTAGHAATADEATNATMINNHRVVVMTQSQYDIAVKDPDTVYLVGVE